MKNKKQSRRKKPNERSTKLTEFYEAFKILDPKERVDLVNTAVHEMSGKGLLTPDEAKQLVSNPEQWLREFFQN